MADLRIEISPPAAGMPSEGCATRGNARGCGPSMRQATQPVSKYRRCTLSWRGRLLPYPLGVAAFVDVHGDAIAVTIRPADGHHLRPAVGQDHSDRVGRTDRPTGTLTSYSTP